MLPKRFPGRIAIADARKLAERKEADDYMGTSKRVAGRVLARRDMGKVTFLDLVDRSGRIQLICARELTGRVRARSRRHHRRRRRARQKSKRGEPSLLVVGLSVLRKIRRPLPDTFHGLTDAEPRYRQRYLDLLDERGDARRLSTCAPAW